jgi:hypothetical protein
MSGAVTEWLKPKQPLALWWERNYPGLRPVAVDLAARLVSARTTDQAHPGSGIPVDTPGLRYYDYALVGGAIDYRMRMEFTPGWGGDPERSAFTRAWAGKRGSLAHAAAALLADCSPALARAVPRTTHLARSLPALALLLEESAARLDQLAPWDWSRLDSTGGHEESRLLNYCFVLAELDNFYRSWGAHFDFRPLLSPSGYRSAMYAAGRPARSDFWGPPRFASAAHAGTTMEPQPVAAARIVGELERGWPLFSYLCSTPDPVLEELAGVACEAGRSGRSGRSQRLPLLRRDLAAQMALWYHSPARRAAHPPRVIAANPTFTGSARLPADGDVIVRDKEGTGYLVDFKSGKRVEPAGMLTLLRQVLTYALMDERDEYEICRVGFYFSRYGVWTHWSLQELLDTGPTMARDGPAERVDPHRQALRRLLLDQRQPEALDVTIPRR